MRRRWRTVLLLAVAAGLAAAGIHAWREHAAEAAHRARMEAMGREISALQDRNAELEREIAEIRRETAAHEAVLRELEGR